VLSAALLLFLGWWGYQAGRHLWARHHFQAAQRALERRDVPLAQTHLQACLTVWSRDPATLLLMAQTARRAGALDQAEEYLAACEHWQGDESAATRLERSLMQVQRGGLADQEGYLRECLEQQHPNSLAILEVVTTYLMKRQRLVEARQYLNRWLNQWPEDYEALVRRGWVHEQMVEYAAAIHDYQQALAQSPEQNKVRLRVAELSIHTGRAAEAFEHFERLHAQQPGQPAVLYGLARCQRRLGRPEEARVLLDQLLAKQPQDWQALSERGQIALESRQPAEAEDFLRRAAAVDPNNLEVIYNLYQCLNRQGKEKEAQEYAVHLKRLGTDLDRIHELVAQIHQKTPHDPAPRHELGLLLWRNNFYKDALHWLGTALQEDPRYRPAHQAFVDCYEQLGKPDLALHHRRLLQQLAESPVR
jgi:tetratricopeptide (TPR) repeat protein